jgi:hypothetical protein
MINTRHSKRLTAAATVLLVAVACNPFSDAAALRPMTVEPDGPGSVFVRRAGEEIEVSGRFSLAKGDVIRTSSAGARILLESDRSASVAKDSRVHVTGGGSLEVIGGSVLAEAGRHMTRSCRIRGQGRHRGAGAGEGHARSPVRRLGSGRSDPGPSPVSRRNGRQVGSAPPFRGCRT